MFPFGVDYYPEHWPEARWSEDARLMAEAGMNTVRLAEFAWSRLEPEEGCFNFAWLDRAIDVLAKQNIRVILGTPTASAPPWLMRQDETLFRVREDGVRITYGHRRAYCPSHPTYHAHTRRIVTAMADHYRDNPAVIGWQIDNEFMNRCFCSVCQAAFQQWLAQHYSSLDALNEAWGTIFWSHTFDKWWDIPVPLTTGGPHNPGLALDFLRFASDAFVSYQKVQLDLLRERCPNHFVTHNFMGFHFREIDYFDLARELDFVSWDNYPRGFWNMKEHVNPSQTALSHDLMRGLKAKNFWVMEQQSGPGGWDIISVTPRPGEVRMWAYQALAHGADGMIFFRWRTARFGTEEYWHGLLNHDGSAKQRYEEVKQMGLELQAIGDKISGSAIKAEVAMILSYDTRFAFQIQANNPDFDYPAHFQDVYQAFHELNVPVDIISTDADLSGYKLVIAPTLYVVDEPLAMKLELFVKAGGHLLVTPRTGVKDKTNTVVEKPLPGLLANVCGIVVEEYDSLATDMRQALSLSLDKVTDRGAQARVWCDILTPTTAEVMATYTQDYYARKPAISLNHFGAGHVVYVGTVGDLALYQTLAPWLLERSAITLLADSPTCVEVTDRFKGETRFRFVINHSNATQLLVLERPCKDLLSPDVVHADKLEIKPYGVHILV